MSFINSARTSVGLVTKHADIMLVGAVIAVIALMILPMPTPLVDLLISMNLAVSFIIMMMSLYTPSVLGFSSFVPFSFEIRQVSQIKTDEYWYQFSVPPI